MVLDAATSGADAPLDELALLRLLQLVSPALPVGAYAYAHGLEWAVQAGDVTNAVQTRDWIGGLMAHSVARLDVPVLARLHAATAAGDADTVARWSALLLASRESAELLAEDAHLGGALARVLAGLGVPGLEPARGANVPYVTMLAAAAVHWGLPVRVAATACLWTFAENQVAAAVKLVPLGQTDGQRILHQLGARIPAAVDAGLALADEDIGQVSPGLAIASARHERQHARLFRS